MLDGRQPGQAGNAPGAPGQEPQRVLGTGREGHSRAARAVPDLALSVSREGGAAQAVWGQVRQAAHPCVKGEVPNQTGQGGRAVGRIWGGGSQTVQTPGSGSFTETGLSSKRKVGLSSSTKSLFIKRS